MSTAKADEWRVIESLLPVGWEEAARSSGAFQRVRYTQTPAEILRLLLLHASGDTGLRDTMVLARAAGISTISSVALFKRMKSAGDWLSWLCRSLTCELRQETALQGKLRLRVVDGTTLQRPAAKGATWRLHFSIDLMSLNCDWFELTSAKKGEALWRVPMQPDDVLIADRYYMTKSAVEAAAAARAFVLIRMRWTHLPLQDETGARVTALDLCRNVRVGEVKEWKVVAPLSDGTTCPGRIVATRLPAPVAARAARKLKREAKRKNRKLDRRTLRAARYVLVFTTLPRGKASAAQVLEIYRARWQIELVFKRMKQLLKLGQLPHKNRTVARSWILAKLLLSLLLEKIYRQSRSFSPWGYDIQELAKAA